MKAVLFDIDGTLLDASGVGAKSFGGAFEPVFGWIPDLSNIQFAGGTDLDILHRILKSRGIEPTPDLECRYFESLAETLDLALKERPPIVLKGVVDLLEMVTNMSDFTTGIVTGNIKATAWIKLNHAGLDQFFSFGGFGCDHSDRSVICAEALKRCEISEGFLFGDTPNDIKAARENELTSIAVASRHFTVDDLLKAGADYAFEDFSDIDRLRSILSSK